MKIESVPISECVHYRGFRYGGFGNNLYEDYVISLSAGVDLNIVRKKFYRRVLAFRGLSFSDVLSINLERDYRPWVFPWSLSSIFDKKMVYFNSENNPDIVCHYSLDGVLASHINREFDWLERSYSSMLAGYSPDTHGYITVQRMRRRDGVRYLVLDGNHRLSSLHAIGEKNVRVKVVSSFLMSSNLSFFWPGVVVGRFTLEDARAIFNRFFFEKNVDLSEEEFSTIIEDEPLLVSFQ